MIAVQGICDQTAAATGDNLGELVRKKFGTVGRTLCLVLLAGLLIANLVNVAADLMAIGSGFELVHAGPAWIWTIAAGIVCMAVVAVGSFHQVSRVLRLLCLSLLAYPVVLFLTNVDWGQVVLGLTGLGGGGGKKYWQLIVGVLGTTPVGSVASSWRLSTGVCPAISIANRWVASRSAEARRRVSLFSASLRS